MNEKGLKKSTADPCLFFRITNNEKLIIAVYVADGIIAGTNQVDIEEILNELKSSFKITCEPFDYFLGWRLNIWRMDSFSFIKRHIQTEFLRNSIWRKQTKLEHLLIILVFQGKLIF